MTKGEKHTQAGHDNTCGIIMPIGNCEPYRTGHWDQVRKILEEAIQDAGLVPKMVSEGPDTHIIQSLIVQNIYNNELIVCDVSSKNANVMLELGLRLALDRPVIVVKDDLTSYSFDTSPIYHLGYPSDLRYSEITAFKEELKEKIIQAKAAADKKEYKSFFATFGPIPEVQTSRISDLESINLQLSELRNLMLITNRPEQKTNLPKVSVPPIRVRANIMSEEKFLKELGARIAPYGDVFFEVVASPDTWDIIVQGVGSNVNRAALVVRRWADMLQRQHA